MPGEHSTSAMPARSPSQTTFEYSPTSRSHHTNPTSPAPLHPNFPNSRPPQPPTSPGVGTSAAPGLPPISSTLYSRETNNTGASKYYDHPLDHHGDRSAASNGSRYPPSFASQNRDGFHYSDGRPSEPSHQPFPGSTTSSFAHTSPPPHSLSHGHPYPPVSPTMNHHRGSTNAGPPSAGRDRPTSQGTPSRAADPMSLSSIMSGSDNDPPAPPRFGTPSQNHDSRPSSKMSNKPVVSSFKREEAIPSKPWPEEQAPPPSQNGTRLTNGDSVVPKPVPAPVVRALPPVEDRAVEAELASIEAKEPGPFGQLGDGKVRASFRHRGKKREGDVNKSDQPKQKKRRTAMTKRLEKAASIQTEAAKGIYQKTLESDAWKEVQQQEIAHEKERKKDMQRKRRREKTLQNEYQKRDEAYERMQQAEDEEEKEKFFREAQRAERKAKVTNQLLQGGTPSKDIREVTPHAPNLEGGTMTTFQMSDETPKEGKKRGRTGTRPRKSKEQKEAEKQAAAAAHAAMERGDDLPTIAPKEDARLEAIKRERTHTDTPVDIVPHSSEAYNAIYDQIWRDISKKDIGKVYRLKDNSFQTRQSNMRKTAQLAAKEARRWQQRTNKSMKDVQARAKRSMKEMLNFWKRNERMERDARKMAERQEIENNKRQEMEREAKRQRRKLDFLISQTELYSHFIGKKIKTDEMERSGDSEAATVDQTVRPGDPNAPTMELSDTPTKGTGVKTRLEDIDFDVDDESAIKEAARANAQLALQETRDRAKAFNAEQNPMADFDEGEMNFQNPTSLHTTDVQQPKILNCILKEYQLKGLNWLVNLYEQGINGILADEMGLGKTVQSISIMAYLSEVHNIWGPFLVIAPASTLHNWQQEISKFIPRFKCLPYWGNGKERKILRKIWDRKHATYTEDSEFHVLVTSYQLVVKDAAYLQKIKWQFMILDEAQAIKSSDSSRWKSLLNFDTRNRLLLTGTPIQNNMQELWALLHFIMPNLFDSHDEFSDWFSKDIESHAQSNTRLNESQLHRLHMVLKPFMLRRIKKHVQKELGDKIEKDVFCDLSYRQRSYYTNLRNRISIMDLIQAMSGDDQDKSTLMNLVMQFRKVCNHPDLFERAETRSPFAFSSFAETASFVREGHEVQFAYSVRNQIEYNLPRLVCANGGRLDLAGPENPRAGWRGKYLHHMMNVWTPENIVKSSGSDNAFSWLRFVNTSIGEVSKSARKGVFERAVDLASHSNRLGRLNVMYNHNDGEKHAAPSHSLFNIIDHNDRQPLMEITTEGYLQSLYNVSRTVFEAESLGRIEACASPASTAPPIELYCASQRIIAEKENDFFNPSARRALFDVSERTEMALLETPVEPNKLPAARMLPAPLSERSRFTHIQVPSMQRFVTDSGKLATLDKLLRELKEGGHRVLLYFQMTRMIDLMEEYLTYRNYKYCRLDGSTKLEDRRDTVADFQTRPDIFIFLLSTRAGGLGINLTAADTVIFYDSDWNPTIDSQAMDRAHRLGQTRQVTVYRLIVRGTIEERIRKRALQKEEVQRVVISGKSANNAADENAPAVDFNTRSRDNRTKDIAMWLADDDQAAEIERKEAELAALEAANGNTGGRKRRAGGKKRAAEASLDDMYHEGEGHFDDGSAKPSGAATPVSAIEGPVGKRRKGVSKKAKTMKQRLAIADAEGDFGMGG